jgi:hypothetical protein
MDVKSVDILSLQQVADMRRQARQYRKEESERHDRMTMREARSLLWLDFSMLAARAAARGIASQKMQLLFESKGLNKFEETAAIAELLFAEPSQGKGLLVEFSESPSNAFEDRFRWEAKTRKVRIHFYRLTGGWVIVTVQPKGVPDESDHKLLKDFGVQW